MKLMMTFCLCFHNLYLFSIPIYILSFPWEIIFRCYFRQLFMYLALKNMQK